MSSLGTVVTHTQDAKKFVQPLCKALVVNRHKPQDSPSPVVKAEAEEKKEENTAEGEEKKDGDAQ